MFELGIQQDSFNHREEYLKFQVFAWKTMESEKQSPRKSNVTSFLIPLLLVARSKDRHGDQVKYKRNRLDDHSQTPSNDKIHCSRMILYSR